MLQVMLQVMLGGRCCSTACLLGCSRQRCCVWWVQWVFWSVVCRAACAGVEQLVPQVQGCGLAIELQGAAAATGACCCAWLMLVSAWDGAHVLLCCHHAVVCLNVL
jgi:hypothetical protein